MNEKNVKNTFVFNGPVGQVGGHIDVQNIGCTWVQNNGPAGKDDEMEKKEHDGGLTVSEFQQEKKSTMEARDMRICHALGVLRAERLLKFAYDYAWVMNVMNQSADMPHFLTSQSFLDYLSSALGLGGLPSESTISKKTRETSGRHPAWTFADTDDAYEVRRRNNVASRFLSAVRKK